MKKSEMIRMACQDMAMERMGEDLAIIAGDVSQLNLDVVTIREELAELRRMIKGKKKSGTSDKGTQD